MQVFGTRPEVGLRYPYKKAGVSPTAIVNAWNAAASDTTHTTLTNSNTTASLTSATSNFSETRALYGKKKGKWYWEVVATKVAATGSLMIGISNDQPPITGAFSAVGIGWVVNNMGFDVAGNYRLFNVGTANSTPFTTGDIISIALDCDNHTIWMRKNGGNWNNNVANNPATNTGGIQFSFNGIIYPQIQLNTYTDATHYDALTMKDNSGFWTYSAPSGFLAITSGDSYASPTGNTWNSLDKQTDLVVYNEARTAYSSVQSNAFRSVRATTGKSTGKWYWEVYVDCADTNNNSTVGVANGTAALNTYAWSNSNQVGAIKTGVLWGNAGNTGINIGTYQTGDTVRIAMDLDNKKIWFSVNGGNWNGSGTDNPATNTGGYNNATFFGGGPIYPMLNIYGPFEQQTLKSVSTDWKYSCPSGFSQMV